MWGKLWGRKIASQRYLLMKFTQRNLELITENGKYSDPITSGLFLRVRKQKFKSWYYRRCIDYNRYELGLGSFSKVNLSAARSEAARLNAMRDEVFLEFLSARKEKEKLEPEKKSLVFRDVVDQFIHWNIEVGNWEELDKAHKIFEGRMRMYILPVIGDLPITDVQESHVAEIAKSIWDKPDTVDRCLRFVRQVFNWAKANKLCSQDNPADRSGALQYLLPQNKHVSKNRGAISVKDLPDFFASIYSEFGSRTSGRCFLFAILTATRSGTARAAKWEQINFDAKEWVIPPEQLKMSSNGALIVPLADPVIEWLLSWRPENASGLLFPGPKGKILSDSMVSRIIALSCKKDHNWLDEAQSLKTMKTVRPTLHGCARATFRTWAQDDTLGNEKRFDPRIAELCLHHKVKDIYNGAYERNQSFLRRREMMQAWADYCFSKKRRVSKE